MHNIFIGTSGWQYKHWNETFFPSDLPKKEWFSYFAEHFDTVELNTTFYHLQPKSVFEKWQRVAPKGFVYAVKGSRYITHNKKLLDAKESIELFLERADALGKTLGPILFQLPPSLKKDLPRLEDFFQQLPRKKKYRYVLEVRNNDWTSDDVAAILQKHNIGWCIHDMVRMNIPEWVIGDVVYIRFHGPLGKYAGKYTEKQLWVWADKIKYWAKTKVVYGYFNNDQYAFAVQNALRLKQVVE